MPKLVVFSDRAMLSILAETAEKIKTETGGVFIGHRKGDIWYVIENIDPGPNSIFRSAYYEYDQNYINHLVNKVVHLYEKPLDLIGLWHRHPGSLSTFSSTDDGTNTEYARLNKDGAISMLINIDPVFRITSYHVTLPLRYEKIEYATGDNKIPQQLLAYRSINTFIASINKTNGLQQSSGLISIFRRAISILKKKNFSFNQIILKVLQNLEPVYINKDFYRSNSVTQEDDVLETILEAINEDLEFLSSEGINCIIKKTDDGGIELWEQNDRAITEKSIHPKFYYFNDKVYIDYNNIFYEYHYGLFMHFVRDKDILERI
ncbi:MAG: Mov34/MPN/PAD-1 family protein [Candidatus Humimicrobiaceae bacterium]